MALASGPSYGYPDDARAAMDSAATAQPAWERQGAAARGKILLQAAERLRARADELARLMTREMGKVLYEARGEVAGAIDNLEYCPSFARTLSGEEVAGLPHGETMRLLWVARGVVVAITPWNFPAATVTRKLAPALLGGNTVVLKPSSNTPLSSLLIAEVLRDAGLPSGVLNVVPGSGGELGPALVAHPACSTITLTGSTASGVEVAQLAAPRMAKCLLELGGKAPGTGRGGRGPRLGRPRDRLGPVLECRTGLHRGGEVLRRRLRGPEVPPEGHDAHPGAPGRPRFGPRGRHGSALLVGRSGCGRPAESPRPSRRGPGSSSAARPRGGVPSRRERSTSLP